ncbi:hypothetical protein GOV03_01045 [Candidatus Woesearchaeota archaeon]|nr:hypothetical protein [Candidatus Woesearchaeota archaeon]
MNLHTHFLLPFFIALILTKLNLLSWELAVMCGLIGMLIDFDHYLEHMLHQKENRFSLKSAWNNSIKFHRFSQRSFIHHWQGFLILSLLFVIILFFSWEISLILAIGYYSHLFLDYIHLKKEKVLKWKLGNLFMKESRLEIILDIILILGIVILMVI